MPKKLAGHILIESLIGSGADLLHVHPGAEEFGSVYQVNVMSQVSLPAFWQALRKLKPTALPGWIEWTRAAAQDYAQHIEPHLDTRHQRCDNKCELPRTSI